VLDMGTQVKILNLARDVIELSGYQVGRDIDIVFSGLRPGEKLYEEIFVGTELYSRTEHEKVFTARESNGPAAQRAVFDEQVDELIALARAGDSQNARRKLREIVPEFAGASSPAGSST